MTGSEILTAPAIDDPERLVTSGYILGDLQMSEMSLWRLSRHPDEAIRFPAPDLVLSSKKRLWRLGKYRAWKARLLARGTASMTRDRAKTG